MRPASVVHIIFAEHFLRSAKILDVRFGKEVLFSPPMVAVEGLRKGHQN
jgi:hypothetical protein